MTDDYPVLRLFVCFSGQWTMGAGLARVSCAVRGRIRMIRLLSCLSIGVVGLLAPNTQSSSSSSSSCNTAHVSFEGRYEQAESWFQRWRRRRRWTMKLIVYDIHPSM